MAILTTVLPRTNDDDDDDDEDDDDSKARSIFELALLPVETGRRPVWYSRPRPSIKYLGGMRNTSRVRR